jgi:hypothetical protein
MLKLFRDKRDHPLGEVFNRYYWLQIGFIALSVVIGIGFSAWVIKGSLLRTALEQEMSHYWQRLERNPAAELPDTKNLYGYRWNTVSPSQFKNMSLEQGVNRHFVDGKERMTVYGEKDGQHVLLVFGESNVNKLVWLFGLAPLMVSLFVLATLPRGTPTMNVFYEEDGGFKVGAVMSSTDASLQVEAPHGKRSKIKTAHVLLKFTSPLADFLPQAETAAADIDVDFLWECCGADEFQFEALAADYWGHAPSAIEAAAIALRLHGAPMYFYRKGRGHYKAAPEDTLKAALAGQEKRRQQQLQIDEWAAQLRAGNIPEALRSQLMTLLHRPDKNTLEWKALDAASRDANQPPLRLVAAAGGIPSVPDYLLAGFLMEHFPKGRGFSAYAPAQAPGELVDAGVQAFSIDDAATTEIDDAFSLTRLDSGNWRVGVHIAAPTLGIGVDSELEKLVYNRLSTVYFPGDKITMLPDDAVNAFTLKEGQHCPAVSMYLEVAPDFTVLSHESRVEQVFVAANLRHDTPRATGSSFDEIDDAVRAAKNPEATTAERERAAKVFSDMEGTELYEKLMSGSTELSIRIKGLIEVRLKKPKKEFTVPDNIDEFNIRDYV